MPSFRNFLRSIQEANAPPEIQIRQSNWIKRDRTVLRQWDISGSTELTIQFHVDFSRGTLQHDVISPHFNIILAPFPIGDQRFLVIEIELQETKLAESRFITSSISAAVDGSAIICPNDRLDVERIFEILSEMKPLRLIIMAPNGSALSVVLQNDGLDFCDVAKVAIQDLS